MTAAGGEHPVVRHRDRLEPGSAARGQQAVDGGEVGGPVALADRLDHFHAEYHVVAAGGFAVVTQLHATAPDLLRRALAALPERARASGRVAMRADAGYFAGQLARAAHDAHIAFAIGARRIAPLWRLLAGIAEDDWHDAIDMDSAQVAVAEYCPDWSSRRTPGCWSAGWRWIRSRSRPTCGPGAAGPCTPTSAPCRSPSWPRGSDPRLPLHHDQPGRVQPGQGGCRGALVPSPHHGGGPLPRQQARRRLAALPSGYPQVNLAWMWEALLAAAMAAWLHQLTARTAGEDILARHGVHGGKTMIATLRSRLIAVPAQLTRHARHMVLRLRPATACCPRSWPGCGTCPHPPDLRFLSHRLHVPAHGPPARPAERPATANPAPAPGSQHARYQQSWHTKIIY